MDFEQEINAWMKAESEERYNQEVYYLINDIIESKRKQRDLEEQMLERLSRPIHKKWIHEHIMDQYKHEKLLRDIGGSYYKENRETEQAENKTTKIQSRMIHEVEKRLEETYDNIQLFNSLLGAIEEFKTYKMLNGIMWDDQMYCNRLIQILHS